MLTFHKRSEYHDLQVATSGRCSTYHASYQRDDTGTSGIQDGIVPMCHSRPVLVTLST